MAKLNAKTTLAAVALAAATFATPVLAHAGEYRTTSYNDDCRTNTEEQVVAGALGAVLGGVLGSQVSGNGARTEGSVLGAVLGGAAGAAIADGNNDCDKIRQRRGYNTSYQTVPSRTYNSGYNRNRTVYTSPRVQTVRHTTYGNRGYGYNDGGYRYDPLGQIDRRIETLRRERSELKRRRDRSHRYEPWIDRRLDEISWKLDDLKRQRKRVKKEARRAERHYHGSNVCYSNH